MSRPTAQVLGLTRQRELVLRIITSSQAHMTANEIFAAAKAQLASVSFATVYNSLRYLKGAGHITEIQFGREGSRYDAVAERHDHALCTECGALVDVHIEVPQHLVRQAEESSRFRLESIEFMLRGKCPACLDNRGGAEGRAN